MRWFPTSKLSAFLIVFQIVLFSLGIIWTRLSGFGSLCTSSNSAMHITLYFSASYHPVNLCFLSLGEFYGSVRNSRTLSIGLFLTVMICVSYFCICICVLVILISVFFVRIDVS